MSARNFREAALEHNIAQLTEDLHYAHVRIKELNDQIKELEEELRAVNDLRTENE